MQSAEIRAISKSDLESVTLIYNEEVKSGTATFDVDPKSIEEMNVWLFEKTHRCPTLIATENNQVIGFAVLYTWSPRKAYETTGEHAVYVRKDYRGRGVGKMLLQELFQRSKNSGIHTILARISSGNESSLKFHENLGFLKVGTMKEVGIKFGRKLDVDLVQLML